MIRLLKIEWMKLRYYRTFWVMIILYFVSVAAAGTIGYYIEKRTLESAQEIKAFVSSSFGFPDVWQTISFISSFLLFMPAVLITTYVCNEFVFKTHRQNIIDGMSRIQFITVKIVMIVILSLLSSIMVFLTSTFIGLLGENSFSLSGTQYILYYFLQALSYNCLALLLSVLLKRTGLALVVFLAYAYILENVVGGFLNWKIKSHPGNYLPLNSNDNLIPFPFVKNIANKIIEPPNISLLLLFAAIYLATYLFFTIRKFRAEDL